MVLPLGQVAQAQQAKATKAATSTATQTHAALVAVVRVVKAATARPQTARQVVRVLPQALQDRQLHALAVAAAVRKSGLSAAEALAVVTVEDREPQAAALEQPTQAQAVAVAAKTTAHQTTTVVREVLVVVAL